MQPFIRSYYIIVRPGQKLTFMAIRARTQFLNMGDAMRKCGRGDAIMQITETMTPAFMAVNVEAPEESIGTQKSKRIRRVQF